MNISQHNEDGTIRCRPKSRRGHYSAVQRNNHLKKNTHLFEDDVYEDNNYQLGDDNDDGPSESEITADILTMNGGPIPTDADIDFNWKKRILEKQFENMSIDSTGESSASCTSSTSNLSSQQSSSSNISSTINNETNNNNIIQHTDDGDFYYLRDTTKIEKSNEKYDFSFRNKKNIKRPRDILIDSITDDMFVFE